MVSLVYLCEVDSMYVITVAAHARALVVIVLVFFVLISSHVML